MKDQLSKRGNINIITITVVLFIVCSIGFIVWTVFLKPATNNSSNINTSENTIKALVIKEWSTRLYYKNLPDLKYSIIDNGSSQDLFFISSVVKGCSSLGLGGISRLTADNNGVNDKKTIAKILGGYNYSYKEPTFANCDNKDSNTIQEFVKTIHSAYLTMSTIK